jgi:hypothetical protein
VTLNPNPGSNYASWIAGYPGVGAQSGFNDDADHDGLANGVENYLGTDPSASNAGITQIAKSGSTVTFRHPQNAAPASDVSAVYRWSSDLANWHDSGEASGGTTVSFAPAINTPSAGITTVTATITGTAPGKVFTRLQVSQSP